MFSLSSLPHTDGTLSFKYRIKSTSTATNPSLWLRFRDKTSGQRLSVVCEKNRVLISQLYNSVTTTLASNMSWGTVLDTDYDVSMVAEGNRAEVWMALSGQPKQLVLTGTTDLLSGDRLIITSGTGAMVSVDEISFTVPDPGVETFQYNNANELTRQVVDGFIQSFVYDDWGRMVTKTRGGYQAIYKYRFGDKLKQINTNFPGESAAQVEYTYDGLGRRRVMLLGGTVVKWQRYGFDRLVLAEYNPGGGGGWDIGARTNSYTWMGMMPLSETSGANPGTGGSQYYFHDHLLSTRDIFNASKVKTARLDYEPHGKPINHFGLSPGRTFTGKELDEESGLYYFPYRHYSPDQARWMQRDPLGMVDGPNGYSYVGASPTQAIDDDGRLALLAGVILWGACPLAVAGGNRIYYDGLGGNGGWAPGTNDDYMHCVTSCRASRYCLNPISAGLVGILGEWLDMTFDNNAAESLRDMCSNADGLKCSISSSSCSSCCKKKGYDPQAWHDGPHPQPCCDQ